MVQNANIAPLCLQYLKYVLNKKMVWSCLWFLMFIVFNNFFKNKWVETHCWYIIKKICSLWNYVNKMIGIQIIFWMNMNNWVIALMMKLQVPVLCSRVFFFPHNSYICLNQIMSSIHPRQWSNHRKGKEIIFFLWNFHLSYWISTPRSHQTPKVNWIKKNRMSYC